MNAVIYARYSSDNQREEVLMGKFVNARSLPISSKATKTF